MPIQWSQDTAGRTYEADGPEHGGAPDTERQRSSMWNNVRSILGSSPSATAQQQDHGVQPSGTSRHGSQGFRPFSAFGKSQPSEVLKLPTSDQEGQPGAADWQSFMKSWLDDEEDNVEEDTKNGRVKFGLNPHLVEEVVGMPMEELKREHSHFGNDPAEQPFADGLKHTRPSAAPKSAMRGASITAQSSRPKSAAARGKSALKSAGPHQHAAVADGNDNYVAPAKKDKKKEKNPFRNPTLHTFSFEQLVHNVVWRVGRNFGFQAFNMNPMTRDKGYSAEWTPSTIFVASDHLVQLCVKNFFLRRSKAEDEKQEERFAKAVFELHANIFYTYEEQWSHMHGLTIRPKAMQDILDNSRFCEEQVVCGLLSELALYFLIYTEASSMRHAPELLWFLYWCLSHSDVMRDLWLRDTPDHYPNIRQVRVRLRNEHQALIRELQTQLNITPDRTSPEDAGRLTPIMGRMRHSDVPADQHMIAADLVAFGDGNYFYERILTPVFFVMSYEIDHLSNLGVDVAHRLGYDDFNESMAHTGVVRMALIDLRVQGQEIINGDINLAYKSLTNLGYRKGVAETAFDAQTAADWWRTRAFVKTYRERRSWLAVYRAYYRVFALHFVLYHAMQAQAFVGWNWRVISSCLVTHAFCAALERFANWYMTRHPKEPLQTALSKVFDKKGNFKISQRSNKSAAALAEAHAQDGFSQAKAIGNESVRASTQRVLEMEGAPYLGIFGFVEWVIFAFFVLAWYVLQFFWFFDPVFKFCYDWWPMFSYAYCGAYGLHFLLTTRDGYVVSLTHMLGLPAIFKSWSSRPDPVNWVQGTMHMKWKLFLLNALFWFTVFAMKLPFDYFVICKPSVKPLKAVFKADWLECKQSLYFNVIPCPGGDWVLAVLRVFPFVIITLIDTSLFYQVTVTLFGILRALFKLNLGVLTNWEEVVKEFYKAPYRWWFRCMSETGNRNQLANLKLMLFDNATDPETGAMISDGRMFKKAVLTPEEIHGVRSKSVNVAAMLVDDDDDDNSGAAEAGPRQGAKGGEGGRPAAGGKAGGKPLSTGWKTALANFGIGGDNAKAAPKGVPLLPTTVNMKNMQKNLQQLQRMPAKLPMTTITERMIKSTERSGGDKGRTTFAGVAERLLEKSKATALDASRARPELTPEEKRKELMAKIQSAPRANGSSADAAQAGAPGERNPSAIEAAAASGSRWGMAAMAATRGGSDGAMELGRSSVQLQDSAAVIAARSHQGGAPLTLPGEPSGAGRGRITSADIFHERMSRQDSQLRLAGASGSGPSLSRASESGLMAPRPGGTNPQASWGSPSTGSAMQPPAAAGAPGARYSWTGAKADAEALSRTASATRMASPSRLGTPQPPSRPTTSASRLGVPGLGPAPAEGSPAVVAAFSGVVDDMRAESVGLSEANRDVRNLMQEMSGVTEPAGAGSVAPPRRASSMRPGPVAEARERLDALTGGMEGAAVQWTQLLAQASGPAASSAAALWAAPRGRRAGAGGDNDDGGASWWERRVVAAEAGAGMAEPSSITAFRADGEPVSVAHEWLPSEDAVSGGRCQLSVRSVSRGLRAVAVASALGSGAVASAADGTPRSTAALGPTSPSASPCDGGGGGSSARAVAEGREEYEDNGVESSDVDTPTRMAADRAGVSPQLARGLSRGQANRSNLAGGGARARRGSAESGPSMHKGVVRSISGTSLHSHYHKDDDGDDEEAPRKVADALGRDNMPEWDDADGAPQEPLTPNTVRRRAVAFGDYDEQPQQQQDVGPPGQQKGHHGPEDDGGENSGLMQRWLAGLSGWGGLNASKGAVSPEPDEEEARMPSGNSNTVARPKSSLSAAAIARPTTGAARPMTAKSTDAVGAAQGRPATALPRSNEGRTRPMTAAGRPAAGASRPTTAMRQRPMTGQRPTTARPMTAILTGYDPHKEAKRKEKKDREEAIEKVAGGLVSRTQSMVVIDGADPEEDDEIDEVHALMMMWNSFATAWDAIVDDLRESDYVSDKEVSMLKFVRLDMGTRSHGLRPILLPTFFYAGQIRKVVDKGQVSTAQVMVLNELRVLCVWLGCQVGLLSGKHAHVINSAPFTAGNINVKHSLLRKKFLTHGLKLVDQLEQVCERHEVPFDMKDLADNLYQLWVCLEGECFAIYKARDRGLVSNDDVELAAILFEMVSDMKRVISSDPEGIKASIKAGLLNTATADTKELLRVIRVIKRMLLTTEAEATPESEEAQRVLGFFINSLGHPSLDKPASIDKMWSWSILTPLYEEDVMYALESKHLAKQLKSKGVKYKKLTDLLGESDDSISLMAYLKAMFPKEWVNFKERMKFYKPDINVKSLTEHDFQPHCEMHEFALELQMWASQRGQLLARTVHGMMLNETALKVLARLEHPRPPSWSELEYKRWIDTLIAPKFEYVVTPQTYGKNRVSKDLRLRWLAESMDILMERYPRLKVAFLDQGDVGNGLVQYSVMARGRDMQDAAQLSEYTAGDQDSKIMEVYRVRLPVNKYSARGVILGEGKPENQNHAVIFAFGEGLQAIDMNQDNMLCEALKFRNLTAELMPSSKGEFKNFADDDEDVEITKRTIASELAYVIRSRQVQCVFTAIVGFREWIFSDKSGALGRFAAATEYAFGTITQRTLTHPARIRLHYGHPDLFNKMFTMTRGGISKATRQLHLTEDVFCGCNHTLRGGRIRYKEYISCGKGRDMGFDSINGFNFKIAGGGGEWAISRESARLGARLDIFRLMMFYYSCIGFYINSWFTMQAAYWNVYALLVFSLAHALEVRNGGDLMRLYNVQQVLQLGTLSMIPYYGQLVLEHGIVYATVTVLHQIFTGSLFFYMFQQRTVADSFIKDLAYGSARYVGTGRGFNITSLDFVKIFTLYTRSHMYYAFELLFMLSSLYILDSCHDVDTEKLVMQLKKLEDVQPKKVHLVLDEIYGTLKRIDPKLLPQTEYGDIELVAHAAQFVPAEMSCLRTYGMITWSAWLLACVLVFSPMWFNPFSFDIAKVQTNFVAWRRWMHGDVDLGTGSNWFTWNNAQLEKLRNDGGNNTDNWLNVVGTALSCAPYLIIALAAASRLDIVIKAAARYHPIFGNRYFIFLCATVVIWLVVQLTLMIKAYFTERANHKPYRIYRYMLAAALVIFLIVWLGVLPRWYEGNGWTTLVIILYANFNLLLAYHKFVSVTFSQFNSMRSFVDSFHYTCDEAIGFVMFVVIAFLSFLGFVSWLQMKLLFNDAFAQTAGNARIAHAMIDNKVGFDSRKGGRKGGAQGNAASNGAPSSAVPSSVGASSNHWEVRSLVTSEHRYM